MKIKITSFLKKHIPFLHDVDEKYIRISALIILLSVSAAAAYPYLAYSQSTAGQGYIVRGSYGEEDYVASLEAVVDGEAHNMEIDVESRKYTDDELKENLSLAAVRLTETVFDGIDPDHISNDLSLITSVPGTDVQVSWSTDDYKLLDWDGTLGGDIPENGAKVSAEALLTLQDASRTQSYDLTVFPKENSEEDTTVTAIMDALHESDNPFDEKLLLPDTVNGKTISWSDKKSRTWIIILFYGITFAFLVILLCKQKIKRERKCRSDIMLLDYPNIVNKLVLFLNAGMSMRGAITKIALDYRDSLKKGNETRWGFEEILAVYNEMNLGISEYDAYRNMGRRCSVSKYKTLSTLLLQNLMRGSRELIDILEREASDAFEERKKKARILGEEAGTKLLFPMIIMLGLILMILIIPAFISMR
ncbi:MAG: type II secretion system F family protein [Lachnospiraceae bacterium]|jgi:tight adherence protein C